ncbi:MAG: leucine-rich repeat domain-containing protein [Eubacteriales bacterium]
MKTKLKVISLIIALVLLCTALTSCDIQSVISDIGNKSEGFEFAVNADGTYTLSGLGTCKDTDISIPKYHNGRRVTAIGEGAFVTLYTNRIASVTIPDSVKSIGRGAFANCTALESVNIPKSVTEIGHSAFYGCASLKSIEIHGVVTSIGYEAFYGCEGLTSIVIPDSVKTIGAYAFSGCSGLQSIELGAGVERIGKEAFYACSQSLDSITVSEGNKVYYSSGNCLIEKDSKALILGCKNSVIPSDGSVTVIGSCAFSACRELTSIDIPDSITTIGERAFCGCTSLVSAVLPEGLTGIGGGAFRNCRALVSVTIPESVTSIGSYVFTNSKSLVNISFGGTVAQWNAISKSSTWDESTDSYTIHCTDGDIEK